MREEVRGAAIGVWETVEMWVPVKEVAPGAVNLMEEKHEMCVSQMIILRARII